MKPITTNKGSVLAFGELLLRVCPDGEGNWLDKNSLPFYVGGAELNVATALALWDLPSKYFTALPKNILSDQILTYLQSKKIDTSSIFFGGERIGLYFLTEGSDLKHNALIYDREGSSFSELKPGMLDWDTIFSNVSWFHFSAICPGINRNVANLCLEALQEASKREITISVDLNYRAKLWQYGENPKDIMETLVSYCNVIMGNIWAAETMLGIAVMSDIHQEASKGRYLEASQNTSEKILKLYPRCVAVANTFRFDSAKTINYYTTIKTSADFIVSKEYNSNSVIDKVGSGDCFMAGLIYGFYNQWNEKKTLEYATAAAYQKLFIKGDATNKRASDIIKELSYEQ